MKIKLLISNFNCSCISDKCPWKALYMFIHAFGSFMVFFLLYFFIVVQVRLSPLSTHHAPPPHPPPPSHLNPTSLWLCPQVLYTCSLTTRPLFPLLIPRPLPSGYCQFVLYFNVSGYILLACLFC